MKRTIAFLMIFLMPFLMFAKEGMWIPLLLKKYNIEEMQQMGFRLTAEDIYSINKAAMKDAVVIFGGGCTGELISDKGLLITNHHCGFSSIQSHSSVEHDYLTDGFWAMSAEEELPNPGLTVTFLKRMEDVTDSVLVGISAGMSMTERSKVVDQNIKRLVNQATEGTGYRAEVKPFFHGNQYFLFVNQVFEDVRLVGAPPSAIGKFGGDTDNWMWPRHTGDFSLFRIYADGNNQPAEYSPKNKPYRPEYHFPVSLNGVKEGDFTMVLGYPGSTEEYAPSFHLEMLTKEVYPKLINVRSQKLEVLNRYMEADAGVRIQYAAKKAGISNSWKRWRGEIRGLDILNAVEKKQAFEADFQRWVRDDVARNQRWGKLLDEYKEVYHTFGKIQLTRDLMLELLLRNGIETARVASYLHRFLTACEEDSGNDTKMNQKQQDVTADLKDFFKDYYLPVDREVTRHLLVLFQKYVPRDYWPSVYTDIDRKYKGHVDAYVNDLFKKSRMTDEKSVLDLVAAVSKGKTKAIKRDPSYQLYKSLMAAYQNKIGPEYISLSQKLDSLNRVYMSAQMAYESKKAFYPDANFTLRLSYGKVGGYQARDAVSYAYQTTLKGIIEKDNPEIYDYRVPERLKELYRKREFGRYGVNETIPVCFLSSNHTTGGNSGSPVLNGRGELVGVNFDRAWEGVMSDLMFNPDQCRNISLDIRYALFIIDKFAGAGYLLDEMTIVD